MDRILICVHAHIENFNIGESDKSISGRLSILFPIALLIFRDKEQTTIGKRFLIVGVLGLFGIAGGKNASIKCIY